MKKTWGEIKSEIINLGFEKSAAYAANPACHIEAVNRACTVISSFVMPVTAKYSIDLADTGAQQRFDMRALTAVDGTEVFLGYAADSPVCFHSPRAQVKYETDNDGALIIFPGQSGEVDVWYKKAPAAISADTPDSYALELPYEAACLVPLLASFYIWVDEDERLAVRYRNDYDDLRVQLMAAQARTRAGARVYGAVNGDV